MYEGKRCRNCGALLLGPFCHECGQQHFDKHITTTDYVRDVAQRVYRFDGRFVHTIRGCLAWPGDVANDYLDGRRRRIVDPLQYFAGCVFLQFVFTWAAQKLAVLTGQDSVLNWQGQFSGFLAIRILFIFWFGSLWYVMFPRGTRTLSEIYVFATYAFPTVGLLWVVLPFIDLLLPWDLAPTRGVAMWIKFAIELVYLIFAVHTFGRLPLWLTILRCIVVLGMGNAIVVFFMFKP